MSMQYIREHYSVPAKRGGRVEYTGGTTTRHGTITGSRGQYLRVRFDGNKSVALLHPTWRVKYVG